MTRRHSPLKSSAEKAGHPPGTLLHVGIPPRHDVLITVAEYDDATLELGREADLEAVLRPPAPGRRRWILIEGLHDPELVARIGERFSIHPLVLEDILNTQQRPKLEEFEDYLFIVVKLFRFDPASLDLQQEQLSLLLLPDCLITFRERHDELLDPLFRRLESPDRRLLQQSVDYLAYAVIDLVVDGYFRFTDQLDEVIEAVEDELLEEPGRETFERIQLLRRALIFGRRGVSPLRDLLATLGRSSSPLLREGARDYFRDVLDHSLRVGEALESYRELVTGMLDIYLSSVSNRMNEVMKVLTVFATIFIPLTFITGVYGMNFRYMPELEIPWAYPLVWMVFLLVAGLLLWYFRRKDWL